MAYNFLAHKSGDSDLQSLRKRLCGFENIECFPVEVSADLVTLGVSVPFRAMDDPQFERELVEAMTYLVAEKGFQITDLVTGNTVRPEDIADLSKQISA